MIVSNISELLIDLVGRPRPSSGNLLMALIEEVGEKPKVSCDESRLWIYDFVDSGFELTFNSRVGVFIHLSIYVDVHSGRPTFKETLPFGFSKGDTLVQIEKKLPGASLTVKDYRFVPDLRPLVVTAHFHPPGPPTAHLDFISVYLDP